jgi:hypothetical protein
MPYLSSVGISYGESLAMISLSAIVKSIDEKQREPLARMVLIKNSTVTGIDISTDRSSALKAQTTLPFIGISFVSFPIHGISIDTSHEAIEEKINGMANLKFTCPCLDQGASTYTSDLHCSSPITIPT